MWAGAAVFSVMLCWLVMQSLSVEYMAAEGLGVDLCIFLRNLDVDEEVVAVA
jgi:hypothetical protein